jgi:hypothetical protein
MTTWRTNPGLGRFSPSSLDRLARLAGLRGFELVAAPEIAGHPRIIGTLKG